MKKIDLPKEKALSEVLEDSIAFCLQNFGKYSKAYIYFILPPILIAVIFSVFVNDDLLVKDVYKISNGNWATSSSLYFGLVSTLFFGLAFLAHTTMTYQYVILYDSKEAHDSITIREIWDGIRNNIVYMLYSNLWLAIIISVIGLGIFTLARTIGLGMGVGPIIMLFLAYLTVVIYPFFIVRLKERLGPINTIVRCFKLVYGCWWRSFVVTFLFGLIVFVLEAVCGAIITRLGNKIGDQQIFVHMLDSLAFAIGIYLSAIFYFAVSINYFSLYRAKELSKLRDEPYRYIAD